MPRIQLPRGMNPAKRTLAERPEQKRAVWLETTVPERPATKEYPFGSGQYKRPNTGTSEGRAIAVGDQSRALLQQMARDQSASERSKSSK